MPGNRIRHPLKKVDYGGALPDYDIAINDL